MKISFLKIDDIIECAGFKKILIPPGAIQITDGYKTLANHDQCEIKVKEDRFLDVTKKMIFDSYKGNKIFPFDREEHALINLLAVDGVTEEIYKRMENEND